ncbi:MAG: MerR family transcriptional regulator [Rikenellaceae bacterium]|nr:MerR family transcriptional regulator [Rikenellaceae bacterium]
MCAKETTKIYYTMGEVTEMFDVNPSLIRFWESKFDILKPHKNKKGNRLFTPADIGNLKLIYHLVKEKGMTLSGAAQQIKSNRGIIDRDLEVIDRLLSIKATLAEIKQELKIGADFEAEAEENFLPTPGPETAVENQVADQAVEDFLQPDPVGFTFLSDELDITCDEAPDEVPSPEEISGDVAVERSEQLQKIVADRITEIAGEQFPPEYIGELSDEIAEEAAVAAEVREALAELEKSTPKGPEVFEQTLF